MNADYRVNEIFTDEQTGEVIAKCLDLLYEEEFEKYIGDPDDYYGKENASSLLKDSNYEISKEIRADLEDIFGVHEFDREDKLGGYQFYDFDDDIDTEDEEEFDVPTELIKNETFNLREALNKLDLNTYNKYDLLNLYEACNLSENEKRALANIVYDQDDASVIYDTLNDRFVSGEEIGMPERVKDGVIHEETSKLPNSLVIKMSELAPDTNDEDVIFDAVSDYLSDTYEYCHDGFVADIEYNEDGEPSLVKVHSIKWDLDESKSIKDGVIHEDDKTLEESKQLNEGTGNFSYENRCVYVSDEDFEIGNVPETESTDIGSRSYPSYALADYNDDLKCHRIVLTGGYYEGACIDFVEIDNYDLLDDYQYVCESECDQIWYNDETDMWVLNGGYGKEDKDITIDEAIKFVQERLVDYPMITADDIKQALEEEKADGYYRISVFLQSGELQGKITDYYAQSEVDKCNQIIDQIKKDYGYRELGTTARFSNGETIYSFIDSKEDELDESESLKEDKMDDWKSTDSLGDDMNDKRVGYTVVVFEKKGGYGKTIGTYNNEKEAIEVVDSEYPNADSVVIRKEEARGRFSSPLLKRDSGQWKRYSNKEWVNESVDEFEFDDEFNAYYDGYTSDLTDIEKKLIKIRPDSKMKEIDIEDKNDDGFGNPIQVGLQGRVNKLR